MVHVEDNSKIATLRILAESICKELQNYPHCTVVSGYPAVDNPKNLMDLGQVLSSLDSRPKKINFSKVSIEPGIEPEKANLDDKGTGTRYSRTHLSLPPHTDSSRRLKPYEVVAFQCIVSDESGGVSIIIPVEDILQQIDRNYVDLLRDPVYPFEDYLFPIIFGEPGNEHIRYYRTQINTTIKSRGITLSKQHHAAIDQLDALLQSNEVGTRFHLQPGQILFAHNTKVLHGRTELSPESDRLLFRIRLDLSSLTAAELTPKKG